MKRDNDLIYELLKYAEKNASGEAVDVPCCEGHSPEMVHYHVGLCQKAGLLEAIKTNQSIPRKFQIVDLTWRGHDVLDAIRSGKPLYESIHGSK